MYLHVKWHCLTFGFLFGNIVKLLMLKLPTCVSNAILSTLHSLTNCAHLPCWLHSILLQFVFNYYIYNYYNSIILLKQSFYILSNNLCIPSIQCMFVLNLFDKVLGIFIIGTHNWFSFVPLFTMAERGTKHDQPWVMKYTCTCFLWNHLNAWGSMFEDTILLVCEGLIFLCTGSYFGFLNI